MSCELAGRLSIGFDELSDFIVNQFNWYSFPSEVQQNLPMVMLNAQQTIGFKCFGSHLCNRDTFKKVRMLCINTIQIRSSLVMISVHNFSGGQLCIFILYGASNFHIRINNEHQLDDIELLLLLLFKFHGNFIQLHVA